MHIAFSDKLTTLDLHQRTMRPLQKLVIWERLNFPKISTPEPPRIVYYRDPTKLVSMYKLHNDQSKSEIFKLADRMRRIFSTFFDGFFSTDFFRRIFFFDEFFRRFFSMIFPTNFFDKFFRQIFLSFNHCELQDRSTFDLVFSYNLICTVQSRFRDIIFSDSL